LKPEPRCSKARQKRLVQQYQLHAQRPSLPDCSCHSLPARDMGLHNGCGRHMLQCCQCLCSQHNSVGPRQARLQCKPQGPGHRHLRPGPCSICDGRRNICACCKRATAASVSAL
jgi:hypothetical protein